MPAKPLISPVRAGSLAMGGACLAAASWLAWQHPIAPWATLAAVVAWSAWTARWPTGWLWAVPAALPFLNFAPWTGGLLVEEFDLLVLATATGWYSRAAFVPGPATRATPGAWPWQALFAGSALIFGAASGVSLVRGVIAAGGFTPLADGWFQSELDPLNAWRVFKSVAWVALLWLPLRRALQADAPAAIRSFMGGAFGGLLVVLTAVVWERAAYPGLWDFSGHYRTTAFFWEMHVGGGAIDAYLALTAPLVAWSLWSARSFARWCVAAAVALLAAYACLTTFSRGAYVAVAAPLVLLGLLLASRRRGGRMPAFVLGSMAIGAVLLAIDIALVLAFQAEDRYSAGLVVAALLAVSAVVLRRLVRPIRWRTAASFALVLALLLEVVVVLGLGTFMRERVAATDSDLQARLLHWKDGLQLMRERADWVWGIGLGRLPAGYATGVKGEELPGAVKYRAGSPGQGSVLLLGPKTRSDIGGLLSLDQRIDLRPGRPYQADFDIRIVARSALYLRVCEKHLLYPRECQTRLLFLGPDPTAAWRHVGVPLQGRALTAGEPAWPRRAVFTIAVINAGGVVELDNLGLKGPDGVELLVNGDFSHGLVHWLPTAQGYFVPWHIDNLFLELLVERGVPALLAFLVCIAIVLRRLLLATAPAAPFLAAALCAGLCAGSVNSVMDVPRVAFLLLFMVLVGAELVFSCDPPPKCAASDA